MITNANSITISFADDILADRLTVRNLRNVSFDILNNIVEVTKGNSNAWAEHISGIKAASMTFEAILDMDEHYTHIDTALAGTEVLVFFGELGNRSQANGFISSISVTGGTDDAPTIVGNIDITGEIIKEIFVAVDFLLDHNNDIITDSTGDPIITLNAI